MPFDIETAPLDPVLADAFARPQVRLMGCVNAMLLARLMDQLDATPAGDGPVVVELTTEGGEADTARRMALEIETRGRLWGRRMVFLGKTMVYSAGTTVMSAFPVEDRYLTRDCWLLIHERHTQKTIQLNDPMTAAAQKLREQLSEVESGMALQLEGFRKLIAGSDVTEEECLRRAASNWYAPAEEALRRGLVRALV